ncbi:MAG: glycosyltransferase family 4 protein, partial [Acidimicrobiia bacterium]
MTAPLRAAVTLEQCWHVVPGGVARVAVEGARAVAGTGEVDQVGVAAWHRGRPAPGGELPIPVRHLPLPRAALYESWHRFRRPAVERATGPVEVVHATGYVMPPRSVPLVATIHDLHFLHEPGHFTPRGVRVFTRFLELCRAEASIVVCPSQDARRDCLAAGLDEARIRVVPWGIRAEPVPADEVAAVRARHGLARPYVLFVGTVEPRKNLDRLVAAFAELGRADVELVLVGPDGWGDGLTLPATARRLGPVPDRVRDALHAGAAAVAYPSQREGFGLPVLEAMAQGAPVVTSRGTSTPVVAGPAGVLVDTLDVASIAAGLATVL